MKMMYALKCFIALFTSIVVEILKHNANVYLTIISGAFILSLATNSLLIFGIVMLAIFCVIGLITIVVFKRAMDTQLNRDALDIHMEQLMNAFNELLNCIN